MHVAVQDVIYQDIIYLNKAHICLRCIRGLLTSVLS